MPTWFLAPIAGLKLPTLDYESGSGTWFDPSLSVSGLQDVKKVFFIYQWRKQRSQNGDSYLHDVSKNGTTDEDHVLPPRRNVLSLLSVEVKQIVLHKQFPRWRLIPSWRQQERHHRWRPCPSSAVECICAPSCLPTEPFVCWSWSKADCPAQTVFPRWRLIPSWRQQERHHLWGQGPFFTAAGFATLPAYFTFCLFQ